MRTPPECAAGGYRVGDPHPQAALPVRVGDSVRVDGMNTVFEVLDVTDPATVTLRAPSGATVRAGRFAVRQAEGQQ